MHHAVGHGLIDKSKLHGECKISTECIQFERVGGKAYVGRGEIYW